MFLETLESRRLMTGVLAGGVLTVNGLPGIVNDNILVDRFVTTTGTAFVRVQHFNHLTAAGAPEVQTFPAGAVASIVINGGRGADQLRIAPTLSKPGTLNGGDGNDLLFGGNGRDRVNGGAGNDQLWGMGGDDLLNGGSGADRTSGGAGADTATYAGRAAAVIVRIDGVANDGQAGEGDNVLPDVENLIGGNGNDTLVGSAANNKIAGGFGNDTIRGLGGHDKMNGEGGNDTIFAADGLADTIDGGAGFDVAFRDAGLDVVVNVP